LPLFSLIFIIFADFLHAIFDYASFTFASDFALSFRYALSARRCRIIATRSAVIIADISSAMRAASVRQRAAGDAALFSRDTRLFHAALRRLLHAASHAAPTADAARTARFPFDIFIIFFACFDLFRFTFTTDWLSFAIDSAYSSFRFSRFLHSSMPPDAADDYFLIDSLRQFIFH